MIVMNNYGSGIYIVRYTYENNTGTVIYQYSVNIIIYYNNNIAKLTMYLIVTITTIILFTNSKYIICTTSIYQYINSTVTRQL